MPSAASDNNGPGAPEINAGTLGKGSLEPFPVFREILAQPELDLVTLADHRWVLDASPEMIDAKRAEGFRLFRLKAASIDPLRFSALFVRNIGVYERAGGNWEFNLTAAQVEERAVNSLVRIIDVCPYLVNGKPQYAIVTIDNTGLQKKSYQIVLKAPSLPALLKEAKAFDGRITDLDKVTTIRAEHIKPHPPVLVPVPFYSAVIIKNTTVDKREQWVGTGTIKEVSILVAEKTLQENKPVRLVALEPASGEALDYVMETRAPANNAWWFDGLTVTNHDDPDDIHHVTRRLRARPINLELDHLTKRYAASFTDNGPLPITGMSASSKFDVFDKAMQRALKIYGVAGGALAIARKGKLLYARGFGYSDVLNLRAATPDTLFRIASLSKSITAVAVLRLIQDGAKVFGNIKLSLDTKPFGTVFDAGKDTDLKKKLNTITVRHLLEHRSGLHDKLAWLLSLEAVLNHPNPVPDVPGSIPQYKSGNYHLLGLIVEKLAGKPYQDYVRDRLLKPLGLERIAITGALPAGSKHVESKYYDCISSFNRVIDWAKPAERRSGLDAGGWVKSPPLRYAASSWAAAPVDLLRFITALDGSRPGARGVRPLDQDHFKLIATGATAHPTTAVNKGYYGLGFYVTRREGDAFDLSHGGILPGGTNASFLRGADGITFTWVINGDSSRLFESAATQSDPNEFIPLIPQQDEVADFIRQELTAALDAIADPWPTQDFFPEYFGSADRLTGATG